MKAICILIAALDATNVSHERQDESSSNQGWSVIVEAIKTAKSLIATYTIVVVSYHKLLAFSLAFRELARAVQMPHQGHQSMPQMDLQQTSSKPS